MITATLNGVSMPEIEQDFINKPEENATDVIPLSGNVYTDFISIEQSWTFNYAYLTKAEYDALRAIYDSQFTLLEYPELSIPYYGVANVPVRMYINDKNIWDNCGVIQNAQFIFRVTEQLDAGSS